MVGKKHDGYLIMNTLKKSKIGITDEGYLYESLCGKHYACQSVKKLMAIIRNDIVKFQSKRTDLDE